MTTVISFTLSDEWFIRGVYTDLRRFITTHPLCCSGSLSKSFQLEALQTVHSLVLCWLARYGFDIAIVGDRRRKSDAAMHRPAEVLSLFLACRIWHHHLIFPYGWSPLANNDNSDAIGGRQITLSSHRAISFKLDEGLLEFQYFLRRNCSSFPPSIDSCRSIVLCWFACYDPKFLCSKSNTIISTRHVSLNLLIAVVLYSRDYLSSLRIQIKSPSLPSTQQMQPLKQKSPVSCPTSADCSCTTSLSTTNLTCRNKPVQVLFPLLPEDRSLGAVSTASQLTDERSTQSTQSSSSSSSDWKLDDHEDSSSRSKRKAKRLRRHMGNTQMLFMWNVSSRTRSSKLRKSPYLNGSSAKISIHYDNGNRHMPGESAVVKGFIAPVVTPVILPKPTLDSQLALLKGLQEFHAYLVEDRSIKSQRDTWEQWFSNWRPVAAEKREADYGFMLLMTIIMSSSTSDGQLELLMPRLFCAGLTSAVGVLDVASNLGMDSFCALLSQGGRYYQNAERIINAADYFVQNHNGCIPKNISISELIRLLGVGYKTANIVVTQGFSRVEGIPSDIHVLRWSYYLGWSSYLNNGYQCSKELESWLPQQHWKVINPLFGALGQHLSGKDSTTILLSEAGQFNNPAVLDTLRTMQKRYS